MEGKDNFGVRTFEIHKQFCHNMHLNNVYFGTKIFEIHAEFCHLRISHRVLITPHTYSVNIVENIPLSISSCSTANNK